MFLAEAAHHLIINIVFKTGFDSENVIIKKELKVTALRKRNNNYILALSGIIFVIKVWLF